MQYWNSLFILSWSTHFIRLDQVPYCKKHGKGSKIINKPDNSDIIISTNLQESNKLSDIMKNFNLVSVNDKTQLNLIWILVDLLSPINETYQIMFDDDII